MNGLEMPHAELPGRQRLVKPLRRDRRLEALQCVGVPKSRDVLEDRGPPIAVRVGGGRVHHPVQAGFLP